MKFSIIVPVYNVEKYLRKCIDSILQQEYTEFEVILVDDGSSDRSGQICDEYAAVCEKVNVLHKKNGGLSSARNAGIDKAKGEYLIFIDSDDWIVKGSLNAFSLILERCSKPDILVTRWIESYADKDEVVDGGMTEFIKKGFDRQRALEWILNISDVTWPAQLKIVSSAFIKKYDLRFWEGKLHEDMDWTSRLCYAAETFAACDLAWYYHRNERSDSIMNSIRGKNIEHIITIAAWHYDFVKKRDNAVNRMILERILRSVYSGINLVRRCSDTDIKKVADCMEMNSRIFTITPEFKYKVFVFIMHIIGAKRTLKMMKRIYAWIS